MHKFLLIAFALTTFSTSSFAGIGSEEHQNVEKSVSEKLKSFLHQREYKVAATCFHKGEQTSGMNKICYYDCLGGTVAITISSISLCPLTIDN